MGKSHCFAANPDLFGTPRTSTPRIGSKLPWPPPPFAVPRQACDKPGQTQRRASPSAARYGLSSCLYPRHQDPRLRRGERRCKAVRRIRRGFHSRPAASPSGGAATEARGTARGEGGSGDNATSKQATLSNAKSERFSIMASTSMQRRLDRREESSANMS